MSAPETSEKKYGPLIGIIIIISLLIVGGLYLYGSQRAMAPTDMPSGDQTMMETDPTLIKLESQGTSDEVGAIEADLGATSVDAVDAELNSLEAELEGELQVQ
jgi:hypothetical protein